MKTKKSYFGSLYDGKKAWLYTVSNGSMSFTASDYGCTITSIVVKDRNKNDVDVVIGPSTLSGFATAWGSFGAIVGRFANRISGAKFSLDGKEYRLNDNNNGSSLHGGFPRWESEIWKAGFIKKSGGTGVRFSKSFPDGYQGFPGNLNVSIEYILDENDNLSFTYTATTDKATPLSITNHTYFNLSGCGDILSEKLGINSSKILELSKNSIPTGKYIDVEKTIFDFRKAKPIGDDICSHLLKESRGYDHGYVTGAFDSLSAIPTKSTPLSKAAVLFDERTGIKMELSTNCEGLQLYTANYVDYVLGKSGAVYRPHSAVCLETQAFPDSPNQKKFPDAILRPGVEYNAVTVYSFSVHDGKDF